MMTVTYISEFDKEYAIGLRACMNLPRLREYTLHWGGLCLDAFEAVQNMTDEDWPTFRKGRNKEARGQYASVAWHERYGAVLMPDLLFRVSMIAQQFGVPWGTAFLRCEQSGIIQQRGNVYVWVQPARTSDDHD